MQQLPDVVRVLGVPVVTGPGHTVSPGLWPLQHQAALHGLQYLQRLGARQPQGPLHKLGVCEVLVDVFCRLLEEAFKLIPSPLQTEQTNYMGVMADKVDFQRH